MIFTLLRVITELAGEMRDGATLTWRSPIRHQNSGEQHRSRRSFACARGWSGPTVFDAARAHVGDDRGLSPLAARF